MSLFTSSLFASAAASGTDWRDTAKNVLEKLESVRTNEHSFNIGFLYISDFLAEDAVSILNLFRSVLGIENWVGSIGMGVLGSDKTYIDQPAIAALIGKLPDDAFCVFPQTDEFASSADLSTPIPQEKVKDWLTRHIPLLSLVHVDPMSQDDPLQIIQGLEKNANAFVVGGLTSSRSKHYQIANQVCENTVSGVFFSDAINVSTILSQGCTPVSNMHTITRADDKTIYELDGRRALDVLEDDLRQDAARRLGKDATYFTTRIKDLRGSENIPEEFTPLFQNQINAGLPVSNSDQLDYMVRNIVGVNIDDSSLSITQTVAGGERLIFMKRSQESLSEDLARSLRHLRERSESQRGCFYPKAGIYISCIARGFNTAETQFDELSLIKEIIGTIPLAGFYAGGEICNARLYSYTAILILFF